MRKLLLFSLIVFCGSSYAQIVIDGDLSDWGDSLKHYDKQNKLHYEMRQDSTNLYIAIYKDDNAMKAAIQGGIQIAFDGKAITDKSFQIVFGHRFLDPETGTNRGRNHDYFELQNFQGQGSILVPTYNEFGISPSFKFKVDNSNIPKGDTYHDTGKSLHVYYAEIEIPLVYLPFKNGKILYRICLRGTDLEKKGEQFFRNRGMLQDSPWVSAKEFSEANYFTKYFGEYSYCIYIF